MAGFLKTSIGPLAKNILDTFSQALLLPMQLMNKMMTAGMSMLDGNGIYWILGIGVVVVVGGGIVYYKFTHK